MKMNKALSALLETARSSDSYWVEQAKFDFAVALEQRRRAANMTGAGMAEKIGTSAAYISKVLRGDSNYTIETMVKLARATGGQLEIRLQDEHTAPLVWNEKVFAAKPITLEQVFFVRSVVVAMPGYVPDETSKPLVPENQIAVNPVDGSPGRFGATIRTIINPALDKKYPYSIDMECFGMFNADTTLAADEQLKGVTITAHNVLYGAIREAVSWLTARQPYGSLMLGLSVLQPTPTE